MGRVGIWIWEGGLEVRGGEGEGEGDRYGLEMKPCLIIVETKWFLDDLLLLLLGEAIEVKIKF